MELDDLVKEAMEAATEAPKEESNNSPTPPRKQTIQKTSVKHNAIADYMLANPSMLLRDVAAHFGVTQHWLSIIIHSDAFGALLQEKQKEIFNVTVIPLRQKVAAAAHIGVEKVAESLEHASAISDKQFVVDTTERLLQALDYGNSKVPAAGPMMQQNNYYVAEKEALEQARRSMQALSDQKNTTQKGELIEQKPEQYLTAERVQSG